MKLIILCILFIGAAIATPDYEVEKTTEMAKFVAKNYESMDEKGQITLINEFVDMMMTEIQSILAQYMEPLSLPDQHKRISIKPIIITYYGEMNLTKGYVAGTSTLIRDGDVKVDYTNRELSIDVPLKFKNFKINYDYAVNIMSFGPTGGVEGRTSNIRIKFLLAFDFKTYRIALKNFEILQIGRIDISFTGNVLIDWLLNLLTDTITIIFKFLVSWIVESIVQNTLLDMVSQINAILASIITTPAPAVVALLQ